MSLDCYKTQKSQHYSEDDLKSVQEHPLPRHIAIIMDGNRRWAKKQFFKKITNPLAGHWAGAKVLTTIVEAADDLGIEVLTVFAFSTENWERSPDEVKTLLHIFQTYLDRQRSKMVEQGVRFHVIGDLTPFSPQLRKTLEKTCLATEGGKRLDLVVGLNYGGRDDIRRAMQAIADDLLSGHLTKEAITEELIGSAVDTASFGDPDLLIRTSGERRVSNFLLWQLAYTEVYTTDTLWPDFTPRDLLTAVLDFQKRQRRIGK